MRGGLRLEAARMSGDDEYAFGTLDVVGQFRLAKRVFFDARIPLTVGSLGNPMLGAHVVLRPAEKLWVTLGGAFGMPLVGEDDDLVVAGGTSQALWNVHEFSPETMPFLFQAGVEGHLGSIGILRAELDPVLHMRLTDRTDAAELALQYAFEVQIGHGIGGGLRFQGVSLVTEPEGTHQLALEPFFVMEREHLFLRLGMLLPVTDPLGSPFDPLWGVRVATGIHLD